MQSDTHSFIVRIWHEGLDSDGSTRTWRGSIEHVGNGQRVHFYDLEEVVRFIQEQAKLRTTGAHPPMADSTGRDEG